MSGGHREGQSPHRRLVPRQRSSEKHGAGGEWSQERHTALEGVAPRTPARAGDSPSGARHTTTAQPTYSPSTTPVPTEPTVTNVMTVTTEPTVTTGKPAGSPVNGTPAGTTGQAVPGRPGSGLGRPGVDQ